MEYGGLGAKLKRIANAFIGATQVNQPTLLVLGRLWIEDLIHAFDESERFERFDNIVVDPLVMPT